MGRKISPSKGDVATILNFRHPWLTLLGTPIIHSDFVPPDIASPPVYVNFICRPVCGRENRRLSDVCMFEGAVEPACNAKQHLSASAMTANAVRITRTTRGWSGRISGFDQNLTVAPA
tara:strand:+ start:6116 stop:6469 length:354 start_codon:yes stop_codon:yes gene_type:complete